MSRSRRDEEEVEDAALDALASALRTWGELAIELADRSKEEVHRDFEGWARHAVLCTARPGIDGHEGEAPARKDWAGLLRFVREHRAAEVEVVDRSLADLRQVLWAFLHGLGNAIAQDRRADDGVAAKLGELRQAVESNDLARLKREAIASIGLIQESLESRKRREQHQIEELAQQLDEISTELVQVKEQLAIDSLTEVFNRAALDEHVRQIVSLGALLGQPATLFMIDVDHFKWVNDRYGHAVGDEVLRRVVVRLRQVFRRGDDFVARYGGDEFTAVVRDDSLELAQSIGDRLVYAVREVEVPVEGEDDPVRVAVSVGAARLSVGESAASWFERADRALYQAKELGRDRFEIATDDGSPARGSEPV